MPEPVTSGSRSDGPRAGAVVRLSRRVPAIGFAIVGALKVLPIRLRSRPALGDYPDGRRMWCDLSDHTQRGMLFNRFEPGETQLFRELLSPGDAVVDVGAHIGWFSVLAGRAVGPEGTVVCLEPFAGNARYLAANLALNGLTWARVHNVAATDRPAVLQIGRQPGSDSGSVTAGPWATDAAEVPGAPLDELVPDGPVQLLKIDVEGFEARALAGAAATLDRTRHVLVELNRDALEAAGSTPEEVRERLSDHGLTEQRVVGEGVLGDANGLLFANLLASRSAA